MKTRTTTEAPPPQWTEDDFSDQIVEAQLKASIADARQTNLAKSEPAAQPRALQIELTSHKHSTSPDAKLIARCGIAAIDGYLEMRDYAAEKGLDLVELHHKGIDLQDLMSTLIIQQQKRLEMEHGGRRWKN